MAIRPEFAVHMLNEDGIAKATELGGIFTRALDEIEKIIPKGRGLALVVTKLQEASFFAKRELATDGTWHQVKAAE